MENSWLEDAISREEIHFIAYDEFTHLEKIVESTSSSIYKAEWENYGLTIALKTIKEAYIRKDIFEEFVRELEQKDSNKEISRSLKGLLDIAIFDNHINYHDYDEFSEITKIDEEEFGSVYKSVWNKNNRLMIVLKCLKVKEDYLNELIVQNFANKNILPYRV
ncbi:10859_t:CDS:2 [Gigaspora rosea]|nr:10859_t:CDS:2 [Gigaspora rosea]